jgi:hypothetical protein
VSPEGRIVVRVRTVTLLVCALALAVSGCALEASKTRTHPEPQRDARATLEAFFDAWRAEDAEAMNALLVENRRGVQWEFARLARIEFGEIVEAPEQVAGYLDNGRGSVSDVAADDAAVFRADVTFHFGPGASGSVADGDTQGWMWILVRGDDGLWRVDDWGY